MVAGQRRHGRSDGPPAPRQLPYTVPSNDDGLTAAGTFIYILAVLDLIGTLIGGIGLIRYGTCGVSHCVSKTHPFANAGWAVLAGGLVQAVVLFTVARLCTQVSKIRARLAAS